MKIDLYTKGILTVIAFALVIIVAKDIVPIEKAYAHDGLSYGEVQSLIYNSTIDESDIENIIEGCSVYVDGGYGYINC